MVATDLNTFEADVTAFVARHWQPPAMLGWQAALRAAGWTTVHWPPAQGGPGWTPAQRAVFERVLARAGAVVGDRITLDAVGPLFCRLLAAEPLDDTVRAQLAEQLEAIRALDTRWLWLDQGACDFEWVDGDGEPSLSFYAPWVPGLADAAWALLVTGDLADPGAVRLFALPLSDPAVSRTFVSTLGAEREPQVDPSGAGAKAADAVGSEADAAAIGSLTLTRWPLDSAWELGRGPAAAKAVAAVQPRASQLTPELIGAETLARLLQALDASFAWAASDRLRLTELAIEQRALDALERRLQVMTPDHADFWPLELLRRERGIALRQSLEDLALEGLGYYSLPYDRPLLGSNEPAVGPVIGGRPARQVVAEALQARGLDVLDEGHFRRLDRFAGVLSLDFEPD